MSAPTVVITGSSGFLGQAIAQSLLDRYRVIGLDVVQPKKPLSGMDTIEIDLTEQFIFSSTLLVHAPSPIAGGSALSLISRTDGLL
ncbi:NAD-dependent epimerase/dehydratase family protein [Sinorhizobium sp. CB9]